MEKAVIRGLLSAVISAVILLTVKNIPDHTAQTFFRSIDTPEARGAGKLLFGEKMPINQLEKRDLRALPDLGEKTADTILEFRKKHGRIRSVRHFSKVPGIGRKKTAKWAPHLQF